MVELLLAQRIIISVINVVRKLKEKEVDYCLVKRNQSKFFKDRKVLPSDVCTIQPKPLIPNFKIRKVKDQRKMFVPRRKIWKLHKDSLKNNYRPSNRYRASSKKDASVEGYSNVRIEKRNRLKGAFLKAAERSYGWTKDQARQKETWWWCYGVSEKWKL